MKIEIKEYNLTLSCSELWDIASTLRDSLYKTISSHWVNHQDSWREHEKERLSMIKQMFTVLNRVDMYEHIERQVEIIFDDFNAKT